MLPCTVSIMLRLATSLAVGLLLFLLAVGFSGKTLPYPPAAETSDASISRYPDALHFQRSLREHQQLPLWNPHLMGGQPFAANPGTKVWYPLTWLLLLWSATLHINAMVALHLWWGALGMWLWGRRTGLRTEGALLASLGYLFAPKLMAHGGVGHTDLLIATAWLPWLLWGLHQLFTSEITPLHLLSLSFITAMLFIGAIQLLPFTVGLGLIYALSFSQWHIWRWLLVAGLFALGFTAIQWLPLLELRESLSRGDLRIEDAALASLKPGELIGLVIGNHGGNHESITYVGISVLILALAGLVMQPHQRRLWWGVVLFAVLYALGENFILWSGLLRLFPSLTYFRVPARSWFLIALLLPYLAGWGLQTLIDTPPQTARARLLLVGLIGLGVTCSFSSLVMLRAALPDTALIGLFALPLTAILIALRIFQRLPARTFASLMIALVVVDCLWIDRTLIEGRSPELDTLPDEVAALLTDGQRLYTPSYTVDQSETAWRQIPRFDGVDPFQLRPFIDISIPATGVPRTGYSTTIPAEVVLGEATAIYQDAPMDLQLLGQWGVRVIATDYPLHIEGLELITRRDERYFYANPYVWDAQVQWDHPNQVTLMITGDAPVYTVANAPGWQWQHGREIDPNRVSLPAQSGTFVYRPAGVYLGGMITALTYGVALLWLLLGWWRRAA